MSLSRVQDCIVGSGGASGVLALRLAEAGRSVVVLEEGTGAIPDGFSWAEAEVHSLLYRDGAQQATLDGGLTVLQARCLGGGSSIGFGVCEPLDPAVIGRWRSDEGWGDWGGISDADVQAASEQVQRRVEAGPVADTAHNRNNQLLMRGAHRTGRSGRSLSVAGPATAAKVRDGKLGGPVAATLEEARLAGADIRTRHWVEGLRFEGKRAVAAVGEEFEIEAERFFLCTGSVHGAALLHRSRFGVSNLGERMSFQHRLPVLARFDSAVDSHRGHPTSYAVDGGLDYAAEGGPEGWSIEGAAIGPVLAAAHMRLPLPEMRRLLERFDHLAAAWCVVPDDGGEQGWDPVGRQALERGSGGATLKRAAEALEAAARALLAAGAREVVLPVAELPVVEGDEQLTLLNSRPLRSGDLVGICHDPQGGLRMGVGRAPVGLDFGVRGSENLYVCDASLFPRAVGAHPQVPVITMGELLAGRLVR